MSRFIVRYRGKGPKPPAASDVARQAPGLRVVDQTSRMLLVEGPEEAVRSAFPSEEEWLIAPEQTYELPDPRPKVERPPSKS
jgi:hypothetical protein